MASLSLVVSVVAVFSVYLMCADDPVERRWCRYINLLFTNQAPPSYVSLTPRHLRLLSVTLLLTPPSGWQKPLASLLVGSGGTGQGKAWASVARYDDDYVKELQNRGGTGEGVGGEITWGGVAGDGRFDTHKMFRSFGKMVPADVSEDVVAVLPKDHQVSLPACVLLASPQSTC